jgi:class 3 adenylate cyclase
MFRQSIQRKIVGIALGLIVLMVVTSALSIVMALTVGRLLDELTTKYVPAYGHLARTNIRSLERALALRRMAIAKMQTPPDEAGYAARLKIYDDKGQDVAREAAAARQLIASIIADTNTPSDNVALARIDTRIEAAVTDLTRHMNEETAALLSRLEARDFPEVRRALERVDGLRDEFNQKIDSIRADMLAQVSASSATIIRNQKQAILISAVVTALAAIVGLVFALLVSSGITRPVRQLLKGTREVETGRLDRSIEVTTRDEIGQLSAAFNRMVEQLRKNERVREIFGRYIDPKVVEGLINRPALAEVEGQRRVMTVMFCDMKGFSTLSEGVTPQGLVKVMNRYLSTMSEPIRNHRGIIDKYIGDAIMAYWGPPFVEAADQATAACLAAIDMIERIPTLRRDLPELLGVRSIPLECDLRIGIATGEALVGSIGSEFMMSYTVMGDTVNLGARLEAANKIYGTRILACEATVAAARGAVDVREIDRIVVVGQSQPQVVYEITGRKGDAEPKDAVSMTKYAEGLAAYRARRWEEARAAFNAALEAAPGDGPSKALAARIDILRDNPPPPDWDGSWQMDSK